MDGMNEKKWYIFKYRHWQDTQYDNPVHDEYDALAVDVVDAFNQLVDYCMTNEYWFFQVDSLEQDANPLGDESKVAQFEADWMHKPVESEVVVLGVADFEVDDDEGDET